MCLLRGCLDEISFQENEIFSVRCLVKLLQLLTRSIPEMKPILVDKSKWYVKATPKWNHPKATSFSELLWGRGCIRKETSTLATFSSKQGGGSKDQNKNEFHFISSTMKNNVNKIFFDSRRKFWVSCKHPLK